MRVIAIAVMLLMVPNDRMGSAWAGDAALEPGGRVRVTTLAGQRVVGRLVAASDTALTVALFDKTLNFPRETLTEVQVSRRPGRKRRGAAIGFLVGAASGALLGHAEDRRGYVPSYGLLGSYEPGHEYDHRTADAVSYGLLLGAVVGGLGAAAAPGEQWETVGMGRLQARIQPAPRGAGLTLALSF